MQTNYCQRGHIACSLADSSGQCKTPYCEMEDLVKDEAPIPPPEVEDIDFEEL